MPLMDKSFATLEEADQFWDDRKDSVWPNTPDQNRKAALIRATEWIDTRFDWIGSLLDSDQPLSWPRKNAWDKEGRLREGIPLELKNATAWLAREAIESELDPPAARGGLIRSVKAGSVAVEWDGSAPSGKTFSHVSRMLKNLTKTGRLRRG